MKRVRGMTAAQRIDADLRSALSDPGFTPGRRHFGPLIDLVEGGGEEAELAERALRRAGAAALPAALARAEAAEGRGRAAMTRLIGKIAGAGHAATDEARAFLIARLEDEDARTRRMAAVALGKLPRAEGDGVGAALARAARGERSPEARRAMAEALGKAGGEEALAALGELEGEAALEEVRGRAAMIARRTLARDGASSIAADVRPRRPVLVAARCRAGLEAVLLDELAGIGEGKPSIRSDEPGGARVELVISGPLGGLLAARTALSFALPLPERAIEGADGLADAVAERLLSREAGELLRGLTVGAIRYRIAWAGGGKRRAAIWRAAAAVEAGAPDLINDPTRSTWDAVVYEGAGRVRVELAPRLPDARFAYRRGDVPAASHPTIAAALARIAGARAEDVVWDPFVGSGMELCERALLGPYRRLVGSDLDRAALARARENLAAAGARAELHQRDAGAGMPGSGGAPTLIVTNPPMGRRVHRAGDLAGMLERFVEVAAGALAPGGRLVWISPFPARTREAARRSGLRPEVFQRVDMGGFDAEIQAFRKGGAGPGRGPRSGGGRREDAERARADREERDEARDEDRDQDHRDEAALAGRGRGIRDRDVEGHRELRRRARR